MRLFYFLFLLVFTGAAGLLAYENQQEITLKVFSNTYTTNIPILVGGSYLAGMLSGWTLLGMLRRSIRNVTRDPFPGEISNR